MLLAERFIKKLLTSVLDECGDDMEFFDQRVQPGLIESLTQVKDKAFEHMPYTEAVDILIKSGEKFEFPVEWGKDLQAEHERFLTEKHVGGPLILHDYPKCIKPFYMRCNDDGKTVAAMDVLVPQVGEIVGGSQREERLDVLLERMKELGLSEEEYWWYVDLRKFGSVPHSGFGLGFERVVQWTTGMTNIRDCIPFPRTPGSAEF
jgi:asparaginyl-tRNA synthetase